LELELAFGQVLRDYRQKAELSQEALALACDLDRTYISLLERGRRQPTLKSMFKICRVLNVSPEDFVGKVNELTRSRNPHPQRH